ncbi:MAG: alpha-ketoacid dehydrogenase subunit beta, partial [Methylococcales bacterium]|nr:alpha-ketoacid dehydrogenase subunit beta [Methylococcales bacterium]
MPWAEALLKNQQDDIDSDIEGRQLSYTEALNEALSLALSLDDNVFVLGQGVDDPCSMFGVTKGLDVSYGSERVFDTPLSEDAMMGVCVGAAMQGMRPVYLHNRPDF